MTSPPSDLWEYAKRIGAVPELNADALKGLTAATHRVLQLMRDGAWHSATEIIQVSETREGLRRMREIRQYGCRIERRKQPGASREFEYQLKGQSL